MNSVSRDGACALHMKPMVNFEKLCDVYASDLAKEGNSKGPGEEDTSPAVGAGDVETKDDNNKPSTGKQGPVKSLPGFDIDQVVMAVGIIGRDPADTELFLKMEDPYKVVFVKQELEAVKNKAKDA
ncbi:hypothetical protein BS78_05G185000 [Paspalum vaginatum]|nr:hypothetical protein BS78_05G185000 [Paspalum vaginatum]